MTDIRVLTWNLFHGRDAPPDPGLYTSRSKWLRRTERNQAHVQVNRHLYPEFAALLRGADWDVALLQECPPRWVRPLAGACAAQSAFSLTSRNWALPLTSALARISPDLIGSAEGGSNAILARAGAGEIESSRKVSIRRARPERRTMVFVRLGSGLCVAGLHASQATVRAEADLRRAAKRAIEWAAGSPLVLGGDFNARPGSSTVFAELAERYGLRGTTAERSIDHLLVSGAELIEPPRAWPVGAREVPEDGLALRLSDHAPVEALLRIADREIA